MHRSVARENIVKMQSVLFQGPWQADETFVASGRKYNRGAHYNPRRIQTLVTQPVPAHVFLQSLKGVCKVYKLFTRDWKSSVSTLPPPLPVVRSFLRSLYKVCKVYKLPTNSLRTLGFKFLIFFRCWVFTMNRRNKLWPYQYKTGQHGLWSLFSKTFVQPVQLEPLTSGRGTIS